MIENLQLFVNIIRKGGMAAAGREMGMSPATVSARLSSLEEHFGVRLLHRTTRSLSPTPEGHTLLESAQQVLAEMQELESRVRHGADHFAGSIRISAPMDLGRNWLVPWVDAFMKVHPNVSVALQLSDGFVNLSRGGFDLALRYGDLGDSTLRSRKLAEVRRVVCASPSYLARSGTPKTPEELDTHNCLVMRFGNETNQVWRFRANRNLVQVVARGNRESNDGELVRQWCLAGLGIARKSEPDVADDLASGHLVRLLSSFEPEPVALQLVYPGGPLTRRVRGLIDFVVENRESLPQAAENT